MAEKILYLDKTAYHYLRHRLFLLQIIDGRKTCVKCMRSEKLANDRFLAEIRSTILSCTYICDCKSSLRMHKYNRNEHLLYLVSYALTKYIPHRPCIMSY